MDSQPKILIVEDNAIVAADIKARIHRLGYRVTECVSRGEKAISSVHQSTPQLILMDIKLKGDMSGIEAARTIKRDYDIPIIYLTSYNDKATIEKAKQTNPFGYIVKPFEDKDLNTAIEISLHKHASDRALKENEEWLKTTLKSIGDGVIAADTTGRVTFMNPVAEKLTGWTLEEAAGKQITQIFQIVSEKTGDLVENPVNKVLRTGQIVSLANHTLLISRDGKKRPIKDSGSPILLDDKEPKGVVLVFQDNTEARQAEARLEQSEERFRKLFEYAPLPYQSLDNAGNFLEVNRTWLDILGYEKQDVLGKNFADFLNPEWRNHFFTNFPKFKSIGEVLGVEFEMQRKDGTFITVQFDGKTSTNTAGEFLQTHCVFRDVTKELELQKLLKEQEKILRQNQKLEAMGTLAGGIAHDFNNILSAIMGFTELSLDEADHNPTLRDNLMEVLTAGNRAKELVQQILTYSRQGDEEKKTVLLEQILQEAVSLLRATIPTSIDITTTITNRDIHIQANSSQIHQVFVNLITNAVHAITNSGAINISLKQIDLSDSFAPTLIKLPPGEYVEIIVKDNGQGIAKIHLETIFDPYFTTKSPDKGSGLGLSVVHGIVKSHGGDISVSSEVGIGTEVKIILPLTHEEVQQDLLIEHPNKLLTGSEHLLVVDDEPSIVNILKRHLNKAGYEITTHTSSQEAYDSFKAEPDKFSMVITDMTMPEMNGDELAHAVRSIRKALPVILCTGYSEKIEKGSVPDDINKVLNKPVDKSVLLQSIRALLNDAA